MYKFILLMALALASGSAFSQQRLTQWQYSQSEAEAFFAGAQDIQFSGWGPIGKRVDKVTAELISYSGQIFQVVPGQSMRWGEAHNGGWIILDISSAAKSDPVMAFRLAHEWGHESLGHQANIYHPQGQAWRLNPLPTTKEDEADAYAGRFLAAFKYDITSVLAELRSLPVSNDTEHSDGATRAKIVETAYIRYKDANVTNAGGEVCRSIQTVFAAGRSYLQRQPFSQGRVFSKFVCSPYGDSNGNPNRLICRPKPVIDDPQALKRLKRQLIAEIDKCLTSADYQFTNSYIGAAYSKRIDGIPSVAIAGAINVDPAVEDSEDEIRLDLTLF